MSAIGRLFRGQSSIEFAPLWKKSLMISGALVLIALLAWLTRGLNLGIEFEGGQSWELVSETTNTEDLRAAVEATGVEVGPVQEIAGDLFRVRARIENADTAVVSQVSAALAEEAGIAVNDISTNSVGPSWGDELTSKARNALIVFFIVLFLYIAVRLEWKMAVGAMVAVLHDIILTVGVYAIFQFEVTAATIIAFLTILGYSLYDTLVVFDKIKENEARVKTSSRLSYSGLVSHSLNQVVMRSINTTITSVLPVLSVLVIGRFILGEVTLQEFAVALLVGLIVGTYSSLFVATPVVAWLKEREPENIQRRNLLSEEETSTAVVADELASADRTREFKAKARTESSSGGSTATATRDITAKRQRPTSSGEIPARPRKKKRK